MVVKIITSYFNLFNFENKQNIFNLQKYLAFIPIVSLRLLYMNKVLISKPEFKHTNSKVIITLYVYASKNQSFDWLYKFTGETKDIMLNELDYKKKFDLSKLISKFYNKKVVFRIIQLRYLYMNSSILVEYLAILLGNRKISVVSSLSNVLSRVKIAIFNNLRAECQNFKSNKNSLQKLSLLNNISSVSVDNLKNNKLVNNYLLKNIILMSTFNKGITGLKVQIAGRLTRRSTAARSIFKVGQVGILKNINSSFLGNSVGVIRGHLKPNIQQAFKNSQTKNGSFNVKV
jgi:hypothetical protein